MTQREQKAFDVLEFTLDARKCMGAIAIDAEDALELRNLIKNQERIIDDLEEENRELNKLVKLYRIATL